MTMALWNTTQIILLAFIFLPAAQIKAASKKQVKQEVNSGKGANEQNESRKNRGYFWSIRRTANEETKNSTVNKSKKSFKQRMDTGRKKQLPVDNKSAVDSAEFFDASAEPLYFSAEDKSVFGVQNGENTLASICLPKHVTEGTELENVLEGMQGAGNNSSAEQGGPQLEIADNPGGEEEQNEHSGVPFELEGGAVAINYVQPIRILHSNFILMLGVQRDSNGTYCVRLNGYGTVPPFFGTFDLKWEKQLGEASGKFIANSTADLQIKKGDVMLSFPVKVVARVLAQKMARALRQKTVRSWDGLARLLALGMLRSKPTADEFANAIAEKSFENGMEGERDVGSKSKNRNESGNGVKRRAESSKKSSKKSQ